MCAGKTPSLFRHDLIGLHANSKLNHRFTLSVNAMTKVSIWEQLLFVRKVPVPYQPNSFNSSLLISVADRGLFCADPDPRIRIRFIFGANPDPADPVPF